VIGDIWIGVAVGGIVGSGVGVTVLNKVGLGAAVVVEVLVAARDGEGSTRVAGGGVTSSGEHPALITNNNTIVKKRKAFEGSVNDRIDSSFVVHSEITALNTSIIYPLTSLHHPLI
jgi:hypothetical protein